MKWISIENSHQLPRDERPFLALWKGLIVMAQYDQHEGRFYIQPQPSHYPSFVLPQERESKFTHWMELPPMPEDY